MANPPIIPVKTAIESFRDNGYRDAASAISEIIDNSIEAKAKNIKILVFEKSEIKANRPMKQISEIAIVDDGIGMDETTLKTSLQFGNGTKLKTRKGIGRFGIGLPNASISQCKHVEIYSWRKSKCLFTYLDIEETKKSDKQDINDIVEKDLPEHISKEIKKSDNGTAVVWSNCDRIHIARGETLYRRMSRDLCRIFRHFLDDDDTYGNKVNIIYKVVDGNFEHALVPNDPLYLMKPNNLPGHENEAVFELKSDNNSPREGKIELAFINPITKKPDKSDVFFRFSFIKDKIWRKYTSKGSPFQTHLKRNAGISFVRDGREIDFGNFNYFVIYELKDRYWGCEIRFDPILDEIFGVTNNKQRVRNMGVLNKDLRKDYNITDEEVKNSPNLRLREEITKRFQHFRSQYLGQIDKKAAGSRSNNIKSPTIADRIFKKRKVLTRTQVISQTKTKEQIDQEYKNRLKQLAEKEGRTLTEKQLNELVEATRKLDVDIGFNGWSGSQFFTTEIVGKTATVYVNLDHKFHSKLYKSLAEELDKTNIEIVDFMLMSWARVEDELVASNVELDTFVKIKEKWGQILTELLDEQDRIIN